MAGHISTTIKSPRPLGPSARALSKLVTTPEHNISAFVLKTNLMLRFSIYLTKFFELSTWQFVLWSFGLWSLDFGFRSFGFWFFLRFEISDLKSQKLRPKTQDPRPNTSLLLAARLHARHETFRPSSPGRS